MNISIYQIDAFANKVFEGNPAAVCPLDEWLSDEVMQSIAQENNLSETAFFVKTTAGFHIRWFTPVAEVDLCGHATLAAAYVLFNNLGFKEKTIIFESKSGILEVTKNNDMLTMNFPSQPPEQCLCPQEITNAFPVTPLECLKAEDYIVVFEDEQDVCNISPDYSELYKLDLRGVIITSASKQYDFVVRFFAPKYGIKEDPVTGSAYTQLVPYWARKLEKIDFHAKQLSKRGGHVYCQYEGDRVSISGKAVEYMRGNITV